MLHDSNGLGHAHHIVHGALAVAPARDSADLIADRQRALLVDVTGHLSAVAPRRMLQGMLALGHAWRTINAAAGADVSRVLERDLWTIPTDRHAAVLRAWAALSGRPGSSPQTRARALAAGYVPPLAWDDDAMSDPQAVPLDVVRPLKSRPEPDALVEDIEWMAGHGETLAGVSMRLGRRPATLARWLHRHGRSDLLAVLGWEAA